MSAHIEPAPAWIHEHVEKFEGFTFINPPRWVFAASDHVWCERKKHFVATRPPQADIELAYALWRELDAISQRWYLTAVGRGIQWLPITQDELGACRAASDEIIRFREAQSKAQAL